MCDDFFETEVISKNTTRNTLLGTVIKCPKGTGSAWEILTTKSCVFYNQYNCTQCSASGTTILQAQNYKSLKVTNLQT